MNGVDMLMEMCGQRPSGCPDKLGTILMFVDGIFGIEKLFNGADRKLDTDPVLGWCIAELS